MFNYLKDIFDKLFDAELGMYFGQQFRKRLRDQQINYETLVKEHHEKYCNLDCRMSLKIRFLHYHSNFYSEYLGEINYEQGGRNGKNNGATLLRLITD